MPLSETLRNQNLNRLSQQFLLLIAKNLLGLRIDQHDRATSIYNDHRIRRGLQKSFESLLGALGGGSQFMDLWDQGRKNHCCGKGRKSRYHLDCAGEPVHRLTDNQNFHEVSESTRNNEGAECNEHPAEGDRLTLSPNQVRQGTGDCDIRKSDQQIGSDMQPDKASVAKITIEMWKK